MSTATTTTTTKTKLTANFKYNLLEQKKTLKAIYALRSIRHSRLVSSICQ